MQAFPMQNAHAPHIPVLLNPVLATLAPKDGETYVDGTFGAGGYTTAILEQANCNVIALDQDKNVRAFADAIAERFPGRFTFIEGRFGNMVELLSSIGIEKVDGIVLDIGVSSMQLDEAARGFSFQQDGPLDMRMSGAGVSAADFVNDTAEEAIADVLYHLGGERKSRRIAKAIVEARQEKPFTRTLELASVIASVLGHKHGQIHPATRSFQAIRIWVNDELGELEAALEAAKQLLREGGRLVVVTFHSLEDAIVKRVMKGEAKPTYSRHVPGQEVMQEKSGFILITKKPIAPEREETKINPRSRSAKLRAAVWVGN